MPDADVVEDAVQLAGRDAIVMPSVAGTHRHSCCGLSGERRDSDTQTTGRACISGRNSTYDDEHSCRQA